jgi:hypothetical protein
MFEVHRQLVFREKGSSRGVGFGFVFGFVFGVTGAGIYEIS